MTAPRGSFAGERDAAAPVTLWIEWRRPGGRHSIAAAALPANDPRGAVNPNDIGAARLGWVAGDAILRIARQIARRRTASSAAPSQRS